MAQFEIAVTEAGRALLAGSIGGQAVTFTRMALGDGLYTGDLSGVEEMLSQKLSLTVSQVGREENRVKIRAVMGMNQLETPFYWRELGVFAKGADQQEVLAVYGSAGQNGDYLTDEAGVLEEREFVLNILVEQNEVVTELSGVLFASQAELEEHVEDEGIHVSISQKVHTLTHQGIQSGAQRLTGLNGATGILSCQFKAVNPYTTSSPNFSIDGVTYTPKLQNGETPDSDLFAANAVVSCVVDTSSRTINFKSGGGLSNSRLALANATAADVAEGKTFYAGNKTLKTGTLVPYKYATGTVRMPRNDNPQVGDTVLTISGLNFRPFLLVVRSYEGAQNYPLWDRFLTCVNEPDSDTTLTGFLVHLELVAGYDDATWPVAMTTQQGGATVRITEDWGAQNIYPANCYYYAVGL